MSRNGYISVVFKAEFGGGEQALQDYHFSPARRKRVERGSVELSIYIGMQLSKY